MGLSRIFKMNGNKESEGVWIEFPANEDGSIPRFKISRMAKSNKAYSRALDKATKPHRRAIQLDTLPDDMAEKLVKDVFAETVLKDWENVKMSDVTGDEDAEGFAPFIPQNAMRLFDNLPEVYEALHEQANKASLFRDETLEKSAKDL